MREREERDEGEMGMKEKRFMPRKRENRGGGVRGKERKGERGRERRLKFREFDNVVFDSIVE